MERRIIIFSGRVQGVGFRMTAVHCARGLPLAGTVKNLPDGRVELDVQGERGDIESLLTRLAEHFGGNIRKVDQNPHPLRPDLDEGLRITH